MSNNIKGTLGLIKVLESATTLGWHVFPAFDDHSPVDLIIMNNLGKTLRLQVKYREPITRLQVERYELAAKSTVNGKLVPIDRNLIDGWAVYMANRDEVKFVPLSAMNNKKSINLDPEANYTELNNW